MTDGFTCAGHSCAQEATNQQARQPLHVLATCLSTQVLQPILQAPPKALTCLVSLLPDGMFLWLQVIPILSLVTRFTLHGLLCRQNTKAET